MHVSTYMLVLQTVFEHGHLIIEQGQPGEEFFIIHSGEVVCSARKNWLDFQEEPKVEESVDSVWGLVVCTCVAHFYEQRIKAFSARLSL